ncbi:MAG: hypothetical protein RR233_00925 [Clostridiales bacterium]
MALNWQSQWFKQSQWFEIGLSLTLKLNIGYGGCFLIIAILLGSGVGEIFHFASDFLLFCKNVLTRGGFCYSIVVVTTVVKTTVLWGLKALFALSPKITKLK